MKDKKTAICPFCGEIYKLGNWHHTKNCFEKWYKNQNIEELKNKFYNEYVVKEKSILTISKEFNLSYGNVECILKRLNIKKRTLSEECSTNTIKEKRKKTNIEKYGVEHNFCKNHPSRKSWEERLLNEEGITNVFQRESVKKQIQKTMLEKYGEEGIYEIRTKGSTLNYWIDKLGKEEGIKHYNEICFNKGKAGRKSTYIEMYGDEWQQKWNERILNFTKNGKRGYTGLNDKFEKLLKRNEIKYEREFVLPKSDYSFYSYDFKVNNVLIELNGLYWHCSPKKYKANDLVKFPGRIERASNVWKRDKDKKEFAENIGYTVITIWEDELKLVKNKIINFLKNETSKD